ncbi:hypothetical protein NLI96_g13098 [Meripilus lineatus]|uniref:Uncharacterized protein n=1 Tax=Meripilus lineatus TaxID=2056292 RepID=A0AAD5UR41_9APHY|nr:hypothetical protein NLI96_g13098 [Physisporinus lineatus]
MEASSVNDVDSDVGDEVASFLYEYESLMRSAGWLFWEYKYNLGNLKTDSVNEIENDFPFDPWDEGASWYSPADDEFRETFVDPLWATQDLDPYKMENAAQTAERIHFEDDMRLTCAWAVSGRQLFDENVRSKGWQHLCRAYDHLGQARLRARVPTLFENVISNRGQAGAKKRDAKFVPLRNLARELAAKKNYPSKRNAALSIKDEVLASAKDHEINLSADQAERTITRWLDGMLFGRKQ